MKNKNRLLKILQVLQKENCAYFNSSFCDCKYLSEDKINPVIHSVHYMSESNKCPDIRDIIHIFKKMTEAEFLRIQKRKVK